MWRKLDCKNAGLSFEAKLDHSW